MATLFSNNDASGTLVKAYTSRISVAANSGRTYWYVGNPSLYARLFLSLGNDHGSGVGCLVIEPGDGLDSSALAELTQGALFVCGATDGQTFTFEELASAQSAFSVAA